MSPQRARALPCVDMEYGWRRSGKSRWPSKPAWRSLSQTITRAPGAKLDPCDARKREDAPVDDARPLPDRPSYFYFVTMRRVGATVLLGAIGEIENVNQVFHPDARLAASNSP
jgi:hypothetical protein